MSAEPIENIDNPTNETNGNTATYKVELPAFQGPLDLLLSLIEREELDITRIALAQVTNQYLAYINSLQETDPNELTDFLMIAAKLILLKSQVLLPKPPPSVLEEADEDVGDELVRQLLTYKRFKAIAIQLRQWEEVGLRNYVRRAAPPKIEAKFKPGEGNLDKFLKAAMNAFAIKPEEPDVDEVVSRQTVTIGQQMATIRQRLTIEPELYFHSLLTARPDRVAVIVTFLAVLELIKRRVILADQPERFGELVIYPNQNAPELNDTEWESLSEQIDVS